MLLFQAMGSETLHQQHASPNDALTTLSIAWMAEAYRYASSVRLNTEHSNFRAKPLIYHTPCAYLTGHALELALKACHLRAGKSKGEVENFSHRLLELWRSEDCQPFAAELIDEALRINEEMIWLGKIPPKPRLTPHTFNDMITALDRTYGNNRHYALKYPATQNEGLQAPRAAQIAWPLESVTHSFHTRWNAQY